jgi:hypothetical protein
MTSMATGTTSSDRGTVVDRSRYSDVRPYLLGSGLLSSGHSLEAGDVADRVMRRMVRKALAHTDDEKVVIRGDHRVLHVHFEPR